MQLKQGGKTLSLDLTENPEKVGLTIRGEISKGFLNIRMLYIYNFYLVQLFGAHSIYCCCVESNILH